MDALIQQRGKLKAKLTRFNTFLTKCQANALEVVSKEQTIEIQERLDVINTVFKDYDSLHSEMCELVTDTNSIDEDLSQFENSYYSGIALAKTLLGEGGTMSRCNSSQSIASNGINNQSFSNSPKATRYLNLPKINLMKFSGDVNAWVQFKNTYISMIHENNEITPIQKLHYLKNSLTNEAADVISTIEFTPENYELAFQTIIDRYDQPKLLIKTHLKAIIEQETLSKESSAKLRNLNDTLLKHVNALRSFGNDEQLFEALLIHLTSIKLDPATYREWESVFNRNDANLPSLLDFKAFLKNHAAFLENVEQKGGKIIQPERVKFHSKSLVTYNPTCYLCKKEHFLSKCDIFQKLDVKQKLSKIRELGLCTNCFAKGHTKDNCQSKFACRTCSVKHHTMLHEALAPPAVAMTTVIAELPNELEPSQTTSAFCSSLGNVLLPTAIAKVSDKNGSYHTIRLLLDSGSQSNFLSTKMANKLSLPLQHANVAVSGLNNSSSQIKARCDLEILSNQSNFKLKLTCLVINQITGTTPGFKVDARLIQIPKNVCLSDPTFDQPGEIDLLIGSPMFFDLLCIGQIRLGHNLPTLQKTRFGWVVAGLTSPGLPNQVSCHHSTAIDLSDQLMKFWEIENYPTERALSSEENECEAHFDQHTRRNDEGRFVVSIPLKQPIESLGDSFFVAKKRFLALERRLAGYPELSKRYHAFMQEYKELDHMSQVIQDDAQTAYYLPHHGVLKEDSTTTKLRVVFNGSAATSSGISLNDLQMVGPTIQPDLFTILIRFRRHRFAIAADIEKMYRQILIESAQRPLQRILWRSSPEDTIEIYELLTVTYGTASAAFLAIRSLMQLSKDCKNSRPEIAEIIENDFYVDDLLSGADTIESAQRICKEVSEVLASGCFKLRKWISNNPAVLNNISRSELHPGILKFGDQENTRTLGLQWSHQSDHFMFTIPVSVNEKITKRVMLAEIAQIFDPLGLLAPCTITAKIMLQQLWMEKLEWDAEVPLTIQKNWKSYRKDLLNLNNLKIPRRTLCNDPCKIQLHGFCDASMLGYGACVYLRSLDNNEQVHVNLVCAKTKVAPLKPITVPKLELCGALLLAKLINQVSKAMPLNAKTVLWSDSTVVLGWIKTSPNLLKSFCCNRVAEIQQLTLNANWRHVPTKVNPADLLSRGVTSQILKDSTLWWNGPPWLKKDDNFWPNSHFSSPALPEMKTNINSLVATKRESFPFVKYSNLSRLERIVAYSLRFAKNCAIKDDKRKFGPLNPIEIQNSLTKLLKLAQEELFADEILYLKTHSSVSLKNKLSSLNPFFDQDGLMRVGGRLQNSLYNYDKKHPILLSGKHPLSKLITLREHIRLLHAGPQLLLSSLRERFWIISGRNLIRQTVHKCVKCFRLAPKLTKPIMGNLPLDRVQPSPPFSIIGIDYAGPVMIKDRRGRGAKHSKAYICLYVCFATKAVHIELVNDLTTESFLLSFRRFMARRNKPSKVYSDNGTNFVGTHSKLKELGTFIRNNEKLITETCANEGIAWSFIPARSPHFGGLWEAGIKSCKYHLTRVLGLTVLTFEELCTLLAQVEALLNSRPISPLSSDPNDLQPLTPAHFLVGRTLVSLPDPDLTLVPENRLAMFQRLQFFHQHIWKRWHKEYVSELQQRQKWKTHHSDLQLGSLVLVKEENLPPLKWKLARIIELHPGKDGINRVATIKTTTGTCQRSFAKLCPLPVNDSVPSYE